MGIRSGDFVGIAEGIKNREVSEKGKIEHLKRSISELSGRKSALGNLKSALEAARAAAFENTDENGEPDWGRIASIEAKIKDAESSLLEVESKLNHSQGELSRSEEELQRVMEEKQRALSEIEDRARTTSQNISKAGGMYGAYSGVGSALQNSMQQSLSSLSKAATILGGSVAGVASVGRGGASGGGRTFSNNIPISPLSTFTSNGSNGNLRLSPSAFQSSQTDVTTPASMSGFHSSPKTINAQKILDFKSEQKGNGAVSLSFNKQDITDISEQKSKFSSKQLSSEPDGNCLISALDLGGGEDPNAEWARGRINKIEEKLPDTPLTLDDLSNVSEGIESLPDKTELTLLYREIHSAKDYSERKYQKQSRKAVEGLEEEAKKAFEEYSGIGHRIMNQYLRGKNPNFVSQNQKEITEQYIRSMVNAINGRTLPRTMKLYRGVSTPGDFLQDSNWKDKSLEQLRSEYIGKVAVDEGFCSTSISREAAEDFKRTWDGTMVEITAPKGANAMFMQHVSIYEHEQEVLLQKGSGFKITDIDYNPRTGYIIKVELIGRR